MIGMLLDKIFVAFADWSKASHDSPIQLRWLYTRSLGGKIIIVLDPLIHLGLSIVIGFEQLLYSFSTGSFGFGTVTETPVDWRSRLLTAAGWFVATNAPSNPIKRLLTSET